MNEIIPSVVLNPTRTYDPAPTGVSTWWDTFSDSASEIGNSLGETFQKSLNTLLGVGTYKAAEGIIGSDDRARAQVGLYANESLPDTPEVSALSNPVVIGGALLVVAGIGAALYMGRK